jgi:hypothetical protein
MGYFFSQAGMIVNGTGIDTVNDAAPGLTVASFTGQNAFYGSLGGAWALDDAKALALSSLTATLTRCYGGVYLYVQTKAASTAAPARGVPCYWDTSALGGAINYVVTPDATATNVLACAGVYLGAPTKGNYCYIQALGIGPTLYKTSPTDTTIGDIVFLNTTSENFDANLPGSATAAQQAYKVGNAYTIPVSAVVGLTFLQEGGIIVPNL